MGWISGFSKYPDSKAVKNDSFFLSIPVLLQELSNAVILTIGVWLIMKGKFSVGMLVAFQSLLQQFYDACGKPA